jgi:hypothetical protein
LCVKKTINSLDGLQDSHHDYGNGTNLNSLVLEMKQMQENYSSMYTQLNSCFAEKELHEFGSKHGKYAMPILYLNTPFALFRIFTVSCCRTNDSSTAF